MPIESGRYIITNVRQRNVVVLSESKDGSPLMADYKKDISEEQWDVNRLSNGKYLINNFKYKKSFANAGHRPDSEATVAGRSNEREWIIQRTSYVEKYTICTTHTELFWILEDGEFGTSVTLRNLPNDHRCWWTFEDASACAAVDISDDMAAKMPKLAATSPRSISTPPPTSPDVAPILSDIRSTTPVPKSLIDPLTSTAGEIEAVLLAGESTFGSDKEWETPLRRLRFHLDTIKYHCMELTKDSKIDGIIPTPEITIVEPLEKYTSDLRNISQLICNNGPVYLIEQTIGNMDYFFEEYTSALYSFARQSYEVTQRLPPFGRTMSLEGAEESHQKQSMAPNMYGDQHQECLPGTRKRTIKVMRAWANDKWGAKPTFLLLDVAGSGESTVDKTMVDEFGHNRLVGRYFFSRDTPATRSTDPFCEMVSDAFIALAPNLRAPVERFKKRSDFEFLSFKDRFNGMVVDPLEKLSLDAILIIDALDECDDKNDGCTKFLNAICSPRRSTPRLRILATGRPERHITDWANQNDIEWHNFARLEEKNKDVDFYIRQRLQSLPGTHDPVIKLANGVFIWARVACDSILKAENVNRLLEELKTAVSLDDLYKVALDQSIPEGDESRRVFAVVLQMILASTSPLSIVQLDILAPEPHIVDQIVTRLGALLVYSSRKDPIRLLHATFREFLTLSSKANRYFIQLELGHHTLALGCLKYITDTSTQEISDLPQLDDVFHKAYVYSSRAWMYHCTSAYRKLATDSRVLEFAKTELRTWAYNEDFFWGLNTVACLRRFLDLSEQDMSPEIMETIIDQALKTVGPDN